MSTETASLLQRAARSPAPARAAGFVSDGVRILLRLEGAALLAGACIAYGRLNGHWGLFALLVLTPDLSMLGYLAGRRIGAIAYNGAHSTLGPAALGGAALAAGNPLLGALALIWAAHIGFDRMLGYGLKYPTAFGHTHLGLVGKA